MTRTIVFVFLAAGLLCFVAASSRGDDSKTAKPHAEGWVMLFDGKTLDGWTNSQGNAPGAGWKIVDGSLTLANQGAGDIWTAKRYGDFVLDLEFKTAGNSGVFIRTDDPKNNVQTGIEVQVLKPGNPSKHSVGALYDLQAPSKNAAVDGWNHLVITAKDNMLKVELNGEAINELDLNKWTEAKKNPDGTANKFSTALKDFKREGHIGFQEHGAEVSYRNVKLKELK